MMAVIINHRDAVGLTGLGEAPLDAAEFGQPLADDIIAQPHFLADDNGGEAVLHIVVAQHGQI